MYTFTADSRRKKNQRASLFKGYVGTREDKGPQERTVVPEYTDVVKPFVIFLDYQFANQYEPNTSSSLNSDDSELRERKDAREMMRSLNAYPPQHLFHALPLPSLIYKDRTTTKSIDVL